MQLFAFVLAATLLAKGSLVIAQDAGRSSPLLLDIPGLPAPPKLGGRTALAGLNLTNIQGDIIAGMNKPKELFFFYTINDAAAYKAALTKTIVPLVTSTSVLLGPASGQPAAMLNVAYSNTGLKALNVTDDLGDQFFSAGQFDGSQVLGDDDPAANWVKAFQGTSVHGLFMIASDSDDSINDTLSTITAALGPAITEAHRVEGNLRPNDQAGHEHFGFLDGIAQPVISGFRAPLPGQAVLPAGSFLLNEEGDTITTRPPWAKDGSFLAFRKLQQFVPEFNKYLLDNPTNGSSELTGARMVGRWKSGAPIDLSPLQDDPDLGKDRNRNNNFTFDHPEILGFNFKSDQSRCPFSAHIRKTHPRADLNSTVAILRSGIPYGPEVTDSEASSNQTTIERGLAFVAYQSQLVKGFQFQQASWADNANFIFNKNLQPGLDPIIGQAGNGAVRSTVGIDVFNTSKPMDIPAFILSRGGEYFFSPPISALSDPIGK